MIRLLSDALHERRNAVRLTPVLSQLQTRLEHLVEPLLNDELYFPRHKAMLSRDGGVCEVDGSRLSFDPLSPHLHRCPRCDREHRGKRHHRAWVWRYQIWLSERAIHLALLGALVHDRRHCDKALEILEGYASRYRDYPNSDNVLGPTRLFFSTYLESIWLAQLTVAALLLRSGGQACRSSIPGFDRMVRESAGLIVQFDEGWSNRQVWNNTALIAAGLWLAGGSDPGAKQQRGPTSRTLHKLLAHGLDGPHGICAQLVSAVTDEGMWFEGENYHFFALRGFLLAAELLSWAGVDLYGDDGPRDRLHDMFVAPLRTILPDLTLPARGDSPYGVSLLQPRFAELWEIGWARTGDPRLEGLLSDLYRAEVAEREDPGFEEIAEQEQNRPAQSLSRAMLGWKALLIMSPNEPRASQRPWKVGSTLLPQAGVAVLRNGPDRYVSLECGGQAGGHGHPDLLHLSLFAGRPILMDFGTASYVTPSLHWYRSTLAHNAPCLTGMDQRSRRGWCAAIDQSGKWGWCRAVAEELFAVGSSARRTVVVGPHLVLDIVDVECTDDAQVDLPVHLLDPNWTSIDNWRAFPGMSVATDEHLGDVLELKVEPGLKLASDVCTTILHSREHERLLVAERPGPPDDQFADGKSMAFLIRRAQGAGRWIQLYAASQDRPVHLKVERNSVIAEYEDGTAESISIKEDSCRVVDRTGAVHKLRGTRPHPEWPVARKVRPKVIRCPMLKRKPSPSDWEAALPKSAVLRLGAAHYRRSEAPYGAGRPFSARTAVFVVGRELCFGVHVMKKSLTFRRTGDPEPRLDNETADVHSDGLQCYVGCLSGGEEGGEGAWRGYLLVPDPDSEAVRVTPVAGTAANAAEVTASWSRTRDGYAMVVALDLGRQVEVGYRLPVNVVVNEMYPNRERRAGQLSLSGGGWVYLRGDREPAASAVVAEVY